MKNFIKKITFIALFIFTILSCSKDDEPVNPGILPTEANVGTFEGNMQVTDDPQTLLGYVFNTKVAITTIGTTATIKVTGNEGFSREFTGTVNAGSSVSSTIIGLTKQTKPVEKTAGGTVVIINNSLTIDLNLNNDAVVVRRETTTPVFTISGKIELIGTSLLKI